MFHVGLIVCTRQMRQFSKRITPLFLIAKNVVRLHIQKYIEIENAH